MTSIKNLLAQCLLALTVFMVTATILPTSASAEDLVIYNSTDSTRTATIPEALRNDRAAREAAAAQAGCSLTGPGPGEFVGCTTTAPNASDDERSRFGGKTYSLQLFELAVNSDSCLSCTFLSFFMVAIADFSYVVYQYFYDTFLIVAPITVAIWLGYRAAKLMVMGGEDGKEFLFGVVGKVALFAMIWLIATGAKTSNEYLWQLTGPQYLNFGFGLSNEIRDNALGGTGGSTTQVASGNSVLLCSNIDVQDSLPGSVSAGGFKYEFVDNALRAGCFTERAHILGIAAGAAIAFDAHHQNGGGYAWQIAETFFWFALLILRVFIGLIVAVTFAISAIWLIFLSLDVVVRGMVTAAFSPILVLTYLYKPTRNVATQALRGMVGAMCTAVAIAIINIMAYVLITNAPTVFLMTVNDVVERLDDYDAQEVPTSSDACGEAAPGLDVNADRVAAAYNFICYLGEGDPTKVRIPMTISVPWFWYLVFSGVAIFALGRKIVKMIEDIVGYQGAAEMANSALKSMRMATAVGGATALAGGFVAAKQTQLGMQGLSYAGGATGKAAGAIGNGIGSGLSWAGNKMSHGNVLAASNIANTVRNTTRDE